MLYIHRNCKKQCCTFIEIAKTMCEINLNVPISMHVCVWCTDTTEVGC
jgi:hypothetical protein